MSDQNLYSPPRSEEISSFTTAGHVPLTLKQKLFSFQGRISRAGYWGYTFLYVGLGSVLMGVAALVLVLMEIDPSSMGMLSWVVSIILSIVTIGLYVLVSWISLAITAKRFHDRGKSAWFMLISFIPYVGAFWILIDCGCLAGQKGPNQYGSDPLAAPSLDGPLKSA